MYHTIIIIIGFYDETYFWNTRLSHAMINEHDWENQEQNNLFAICLYNKPMTFDGPGRVIIKILRLVCLWHTLHLEEEWSGLLSI